MCQLLANNYSVCTFCPDKPKFGGPGQKKAKRCEETMSIEIHSIQFGPLEFAVVTDVQLCILDPGTTEYKSGQVSTLISQAQPMEVHVY